MHSCQTRACRVVLAAFVSLVGAFVARQAACGEISITRAEGKAVVRIDDKPFTEYVFAGYAKPILYPIIGPTGIEMTRNYPMKKDVENEARDHPHHKSLWFTHDDVNGVKFWLEDDANRTAGRIVQTAMEIDGNQIRVEDDWLAPGGKRVCSDRRVMTFGADDVGRYIDIAVTMKASDGDLVFGDTKEGTMAIRTNPLLRLTNDEKRGNRTVGGQAVNSEGVQGAAIWGKRAKWVDYWASIDGQNVGIAIFDHPSNPRHPTWWHARTYGLIAANPFGIHDFEKKSAGTGDMKITAGEEITFRYRFLFHQGDVKEADVSGRYARFAKTE